MALIRNCRIDLFLISAYWLFTIARLTEYAAGRKTTLVAGQAQRESLLESEQELRYTARKEVENTFKSSLCRTVESK